jgi:hypothetical protein
MVPGNNPVKLKKNNRNIANLANLLYLNLQFRLTNQFKQAAHSNLSCLIYFLYMSLLKKVATCHSERSEESHELLKNMAFSLRLAGSGFMVHG